MNLLRQRRHDVPLAAQQREQIRAQLFIRLGPSDQDLQPGQLERFPEQLLERDVLLGGLELLLGQLDQQPQQLTGHAGLAHQWSRQHRIHPALRGREGGAPLGECVGLSQGVQHGGGPGTGGLVLRGEQGLEQGAQGRGAGQGDERLGRVAPDVQRGSAQKLGQLLERRLLPQPGQPSCRLDAHAEIRILLQRSAERWHVLRPSELRQPISPPPAHGGLFIRERSREERRRLGILQLGELQRGRLPLRGVVGLELLAQLADGFIHGRGSLPGPGRPQPGSLLRARRPRAPASHSTASSPARRG